MNLQNIESVEPHPTIPGANLVRFRDGTILPAPASVASKFDPRLSAAPATAQAAPLMSSQGPMASMMPDQSRPAPQPVATDAAPPLRMAPAQAPTQPAPMAAVTREAPSPADSDTGLPLHVMQKIYSKKYAPGSAGYDPTKDDASRKAVRESQTEQRSGVGYWDEEARADNLLNQRIAISADAEAKSLSAQSNLVAQQAYAADLAQQAEEKAAQQRAEENTWRAEQERLNDEAKAVLNKQVDSGRIFRGGSSILGVMMLAIAAGMKGFASKGADNSVADQIRGMIDRDVSLQENDIVRKKGNVDNALSRHAQRYGSIEAGRAALRAQQSQVALARFDERRLALGQGAQTAQIEAERLKLDAMAKENYDALKAASQGTTTTAVASSMRSPRAATAGGWRDKTESEILSDIRKYQGVVKEGADITGKRITNEGSDLNNSIVRSTGRTPEQAQKYEAGERQRAEGLGKGLSELSAMRSNVEQIMALGGITTDKQGNAKHDGIPGVGLGYGLATANPILSYLLGGRDAAQSVLADLVSPEGGRVRRAAQELLTAKIKDASGAAFSEAEAARHATALGQALSQGDDAFAQAVVDFNRTLREKELDLKAAAGVEATERYKSSKATITKSESSAAAGVKGEL